MKLREHPGFLDGWPAEPGGAYDRYYVSPTDRLDVLTEVVIKLAVGSEYASVVLRTKYQRHVVTRDNRVRDDQFAKRLVGFLQTQIGKTIEEIGETEVDF